MLKSTIWLCGSLLLCKNGWMAALVPVDLQNAIDDAPLTGPLRSGMNLNPVPRRNGETTLNRPDRTPFLTRRDKIGERKFHA
jgi:hypothetical protein